MKRQAFSARVACQKTTLAQVLFSLLVGSVTAFHAGAQECLLPPTNVVLWLPFDETNGAISANLAAPANSGKQVGSPTPISGACVANSLSFNGLNQYVMVPDYPAIEIGTGDFTIDAWVQSLTAPAGAKQTIVEKRLFGADGGLWGYLFILYYNRLLLQLDPGGFRGNTWDTFTIPMDNQWHFVAVTVNRASAQGIQFYVDGQPTSTSDARSFSGNLANTTPLEVGGSTLDWNAWLGGMDEVQIFSRALTSAEIQAIYHAGSAGECKAPLPPGILTPPLSQTAEIGTTVQFGVEATNVLSEPVLYQWFFSSTNMITSGSNSRLTLNHLQPAQAGDYTVVVSSTYGSVTSGPASLSVIAPVNRRDVPAVSLTGDVGTYLHLEFADTFTGAPWSLLSSLTLASAPQLCFDLSPSLPAQRFYRAWQTNAASARPTLRMTKATVILLTGAIGSKVQIDYINQSGPTNDWVTLDAVTLTNSPQPYFDVTMFRQPTRLYRLVWLP